MWVYKVNHVEKNNVKDENRLPFANCQLLIANRLFTIPNLIIKFGWSRLFIILIVANKKSNI